MPIENSRPIPHSSSNGSVETINSREPHAGESYIDTTAGSRSGHSGAFEPSGEDAYWSKHFSGEPYVEPGSKYETYAPAYRFGATAFDKNRAHTFEEVEGDLGEEWSVAQPEGLPWARAKEAVRAAWKRLSTVAL